MATREELMEALRNADAAGADDDARRLADMISTMGSAAPAATGAPPTAPVATAPVVQTGGDGMAAEGAARAQVQSEFDKMGFLSQMGQAGLDVGRLIAEGGSFGFADKGQAKIDSWMGGTPYENELAKQRKLTEEARIRSGSAGAVSEVGGALAPLIATGGGSALLKAGATGLPKVAGVLGVAGLEGGAMGGLSAAGHDEDIEDGIGWGIGTGIAGGVGGSVLGKIGEKVVQKFKDVAIPTADKLKAVTNDLYAEVERMGAEYSPAQIKRLAKEVVASLDKARINPKIHPTTVAKAEELVEDAKFGIRKKQGMPIQELDEFRQFAQKDLGANKQEMRMRKPLLNTIDRFIEKTNPSAGPFASEVNQGILAAREGAATAGKAEDLTEMLANAGRDNNPIASVRTGAKKFLKKRQRGRFTADELDAIQNVVVPGRMESFMEGMGKMGGANMLGIGTTMAGAGAGAAALQDPKYAALGLAVPVLGALGRGRARNIQGRNVDTMMRTVTKTPPKFSMPGKTNAELARILAALGIEAEQEPVSLTK